MIKIPPFEEHHFTKKNNYLELAEEIKDMGALGWDIHSLGESSDPDKPMYAISLGDIENKPILYFHAQIHGSHEWHTSHWALEFCRQIVHADNLIHKEIFSKLKQRYAFYVIPCVNPYGYEEGEYANANGVRIDSNFDYNWLPQVDRPGPYAFSEKESQCIRDIFLEYKPLSLFCCHTFGGHHSHHIRPQRDRHFEILLSEGIEASMVSINRNRIDGDGEIHRLYQATAYSWAHTVESIAGYPVVGAAIEPGSEEPDEVKAVQGMTSLLVMFMYVDHYYRTRTQNPSQ